MFITSINYVLNFQSMVCYDYLILYSCNAAAVIPEASAAAILCLVQVRKLKAKPCAPMLPIFIAKSDAFCE